MRNRVPVSRINRSAMVVLRVLTPGEVSNSVGLVLYLLGKMRASILVDVATNGRVDVANMVSPEARGAVKCVPSRNDRLILSLLLVRASDGALRRLFLSNVREREYSPLRLYRCLIREVCKAG